jgi:hypothetical protein
MRQVALGHEEITGAQYYESRDEEEGDDSDEEEGDDSEE